jgi:hypothetical protein
MLDNPKQFIVRLQTPDRSNTDNLRKNRIIYSELPSAICPESFCEASKGVREALRVYQGHAAVRLISQDRKCEPVRSGLAISH